MRSLYSRQIDETRRGWSPRQTRQEVPRVDSRLKDELARETWSPSRCGMTGEDLAEGMSAVGWPTPSLQKARGRSVRADVKDDPAGTPLTTVRGVASPFAAQDTYDDSGR